MRSVRIDLHSEQSTRLGSIHNILVAACETERGLPEVSPPGLKTLWPGTSAERNVDYKPDRTRVTECKPTGRHIDNHGRALAMVVEGLSSEVDRRIVWAVATTAAFRERGPRWKHLVDRFRSKGSEYPKHVRTLRHRYEESLLSIFWAQLCKSSYKLRCIQGAENRRIVKFGTNFTDTRAATLVHRNLPSNQRRVEASRASCSGGR